MVTRRQAVVAGILAVLVLAGVVVFLAAGRHAHPATRTLVVGESPSRSPSTSEVATTVTSVSEAAPTARSPAESAVIELAPDPAVQGKPATVRIVPHGRFGSGGEAVDFGDGTGFQTKFPIGYGARCSDNSWSPTHTWKQPGTYRVVVRLNACLSYGYVDNDTSTTVEREVRVVAGDPSTNGPAAPYGYIPVSNSADGPMSIHATVDAGDDDGWVTTISLDWGDGTAPTVVHESLNGCNDAGGRTYPSSTVDEDMGSHPYSRPGRYTVVSTVTSTGCDGRSSQAGGGPLPIEVPCEPGSCGLHQS